MRSVLAPAITIIIRFPTTLKVIEATGEFLPGALGGQLWFHKNFFEGNFRHTGLLMKIGDKIKPALVQI